MHKVALQTLERKGLAKKRCQAPHAWPGAGVLAWGLGFGIQGFESGV